LPKTNRVTNFRMPGSSLEEFNVKSPEIGKKSSTECVEREWAMPYAVV